MKRFKQCMGESLDSPKGEPKGSPLRFGVLLALALATTIFGLVLSIAEASVPQLINFQGILKTPADTVVSDGSYSVTFTIYNAPTGGINLWTETQSVTTTDGLFAVLLGVSNPVPDTAFKGSERWLGIAVSPDGEMAVRQRLVSVGYSYRVNSVDSASGGTITSKVSIGPGHTNTGAHAFVAGANNKARGDYSVVSGGGGAAAADSNSASGGNSVVSGGISNTASGFGATVGGGYANTASNTAATIGGGGSNTASGPGATVGGGSSNDVSGQDAVVGGGSANTASNFEATVGGGAGNTASAEKATVGGGALNSASNSFATVGGGANNRARGQYSVVSGGGGIFAVDSNSALGDYSAIGGGFRNVAEGSTSTISGGGRNKAGSSVASSATVGGGTDNTASGPAATIAGGENHSASSDNATVGGGESDTASGPFSTVSGGFRNKASGSHSTVGGGIQNTASGPQTTVGGGFLNTASDFAATVGGGTGNGASSISATVGGGRANTASGTEATIGGGFLNTASGSNATVGGGEFDTASGFAATVPGGSQNKAAGDYSFAAGRRAKAIHTGAFVWADSNNINFASSANAEFSVRASGGTRIFSNSGLTAGVTLAAGASAWVAVSDSNLKRNIRVLDGKEMLEKVMQLPIKRWSYKAQDPSIEHIGPMAQEFYPLFQVGDDEKTISTIDPPGIAFAAIQGLYRIVQEEKAENRELKQELKDLRELVRKLLAEGKENGGSANLSK